jgi:hypothetical protein
MRGTPFRLLQALVWFASLSHLLIGGGIMLSPELQRAAAGLYGAEVEWTAQFSYILRPLGAFMFVFGLLLAAAALDPWRHRLVVYGLCGVLLLRALQRLVLWQDIQGAFHVSPARDLGMGGLFVAEAVAVLVLLHRAGKAPAGGDARTAPPPVR